MKYEEYLDKFCSNETYSKITGETYNLSLPLRVRFKIWWLKWKGYLVRVEVEYHYHSVLRKGEVREGKGFGFIRIHKYKPNTSVPIGLEIEEGNIGE